MSDLDYDALDEAVKNVMQDDEPVAEKRPTSKAEKKTKPVATPKPAPGPIPKPPVKPRGRYLDMIHPHSDMRKSRTTENRGTTEEKTVYYSSSIGANTGRPEPVGPREATYEARERRVSEERPSSDDFPRGKSQILSRETTIKESFEFGVIEDVHRDAAEADFVAPPEPFDPSDSPDANNFSLGGKSPFMKDAVVEKRPLGSSPVAHSANTIRSTKNVYSTREAVRPEPLETAPTMIVDSPRQKSGWLTALVIFLVIILGAALGAAIYFLFLQ